MQHDQQPAQPWIEFVLLADYVEVLNGKLYVMGGGWDSIGMQSAGQAISLHVAVSILVPQGVANQQHIWRVTVQGPQGARLSAVNGTILLGSAPGMEEGTERRALLAPSLHVHLTQPGTYTVTGAVGGMSQDTYFRAYLTGPVPGTARA